MTDEKLLNELNTFLENTLQPIGTLLVKWGKCIETEDGVLFEGELTNGKTLQLIYKD